jgi:diacylglycerol kinase (ATP)
VVKFLIANAPICILDMVDNEKGQTALHKAAAYKRRFFLYLKARAGWEACRGSFYVIYHPISRHFDAKPQRLPI